MSESRWDNLIVGHRGQDGTLLRKQLDADGESWVGLGRAVVEASAQWDNGIASLDLAHAPAWTELLSTVKPKRIFYLAAAHESSAVADDRPLHARYLNELSVNTLGVLHALEAIRTVSPETRFVFASSSFIFAATRDPDAKLDELSPVEPFNTYANEKLLAGRICEDFRKQHGLHASVAILFNHESPYRRAGFFTAHVMKSIADLVASKTESFEVGNPDAIVDWSYAGDAVRAMRLIADHDVADTYVVASGVGHTVRQFLKLAFDRAGLDLDQLMKVDASRLHRQNPCRVGNPQKLIDATGWAPTLSFPELVRHLVDHALQTQPQTH
ncbi:MAG: GDP-mannose 4,6-dehydratase [Planctomycetota bacterium]